MDKKTNPCRCISDVTVSSIHPQYHPSIFALQQVHSFYSDPSQMLAFPAVLEVYHDLSCASVAALADENISILIATQN